LILDSAKSQDFGVRVYKIEDVKNPQ